MIDYETCDMIYRLPELSDNEGCIEAMGSML